MNDSPRGIVHSADDGTLAHLPLIKAIINVQLVDISTCVTLRQEFANPSNTATSRAKYVFPVPARAAVCAFEMRFAGGRVIVGVAKEKAQALEEYENAVRAGKSSALVEWVTDDLFTVSVGSIPPRQTVTTKIVFVMIPIGDELTDQVRLQLPMSVGSRYGEEPAALATAASAPSTTRVSITVDIQMSGHIEDISSPSHPDIQVAPHTTVVNRTSRRRRTARFRSQTFLTQSFILTVRAQGLDAPRCFAERRLGDIRTLALQLTLVPQINFPPIPAQEYLFLVDRSGSMSGNRINIAKRAMSMLLHMLPSEGTSFNIFSFGSMVDAFWSTSRLYTEGNLKDATEHVRTMEANYGGTELHEALQFVVRNRDPYVATMTFVLTDGEIHDGDRVIDGVGRAVAQSRPDAQLRFFALGIGDTVSTDIVEGIARAGNGESLLAVQNESITGKAARLLRAGRSSFVEDVSIDWACTEEPQSSARNPNSVSFSNPSQPAPPPRLRQIPNKITRIFPGMRFIVFALVDHGVTIPKKVILRGKFHGDGGREITVPIPVSSVKPSYSDFPLVHTLAARHLITELVEGRATPPIAPHPGADAVRAAVIQLGVDYQLASRYTSFVAVEDGIADSDSRSRDTARRPTILRRHRAPLAAQENRLPSGGTFVENAVAFSLNMFSSLFSTALSLFEGNAPRGRTTYRLPPGAYSATPSPSPSPGYMDSNDEQNSVNDSTDTFSTLSSLEGNNSDWSLPRTPSRQPSVALPDTDRMRSPSPTLNVAHSSAASGFRHQYHASSVFQAGTSSAPPQPVPETIFNLVNLLHNDGSFSLDPQLGAIVGQSALAKPIDLEVDDKAWATALAMAFLRKHLADAGQSDLREGLLEKAMEFVKKQRWTSSAFEALVARAQGLVL